MGMGKSKKMVTVGWNGDMRWWVCLGRLTYLDGRVVAQVSVR